MQMTQSYTPMVLLQLKSHLNYSLPLIFFRNLKLVLNVFLKKQNCLPAIITHNGAEIIVVQSY